METEERTHTDVSKKLISITDMVNNMKMRMDGVVSNFFRCQSIFLHYISIYFLFKENRQLELNFIRDRLKTYEMQFNKLQYTVDYLYKCRMHPSIYCP